MVETARLSGWNHFFEGIQMEHANVLVEKRNHIAVITIDHPPANAWDLEPFSADAMLNV
jgi:hypothetical protein